MTTPLLEVRDLYCSYGVSKSRFALLRREGHAVVHDVSFSVAPRETLALVGESGSGKTTIARSIAGLGPPTQGEIIFEGHQIPGPIERRSADLHREIQFIFQNPDSSLNPRRRIAAILGRPLEFFFGLSGSAKKRRIDELLADVHLDASYKGRFPAQLSGGERQRIAIAQALAADPKLMLCDEIVSALDVSVQATILDLLRELQQKRGIALVFIAHDLAVVRWLAHRVVVLYRGRIMEVGTAAETFSPPFHPYTEALLQSVPEPEPSRALLAGSDPTVGRSDAENDVGCPFSPLCPRQLGELCEQQRPPWRDVTASHGFWCHIPAAELVQKQQGPAPRGELDPQWKTHDQPAART
jgi:peptide/nickel transport system ATP-binding protein